MPPKVQYTKERIIDAALAVIRETGAENLNARTVAKKLGCSTQPVMYHFKTIEELRQEVYQKADEYHTRFIMDIRGENPFFEIGMNYIRFAIEERALFRFLFQSDGLSGRSFSELMEAQELLPLLHILAEEAGVDEPAAKRIFHAVYMAVHGYASMLANNQMTIGEELIRSDLELIFTGVAGTVKKQEEALKEERNEKGI